MCLVVRCIALLPTKLTGLQLPTGYYEDSETWAKQAPIKTGEGIVHMEESRKMERTIPLGKPQFLEEFFAGILCSRPKDRFTLTLKQARVLSEAGIIITHDDKIIGDISVAYAKKPKEHPVFRRVKLPRLREMKGSYGIAHSPSSANYFHWVYEIVPQLIQLKQLLDTEDIQGIMVDRSKSFQRQWLDLLGFSQDSTVALHPNLHARVDCLVVPSVPSRNAEVAPWTFKELASISNNFDKPEARRRIYIVRESGNRALQFQEETGKLKLLQKYGFEPVVLEDLTVKEQISMFTEAEIVLASHGAGLAGICFCRKDTKIIEILAPKFLNVCYWRIAALKGLDYYYLLAQGAESMADIPHPVEGEANLMISLRDLEEIFQVAGVSPAPNKLNPNKQ